jgi:hypothetical protein
MRYYKETDSSYIDLSEKSSIESLDQNFFLDNR